MSTKPPPPRPSLSRFAQTRRFMGDPLSLLTDCLEECGEIFTLDFIGLGPWVFVCSPEGVKQLFKAPRETLGAGEIHHRMLAGLFGSNALFTLDGEPHRRRQRLVMPPLSGPGVENYIELMQRVAEETCDRWRAGEAFSMLPTAHRISLDILIRIMFGEQDMAQARDLSHQFHEFAQRGTRSMLIRMPWLQKDLGPLSPWGRVLRLRDETRQCFRTSIRDSPEQTQLLEVLRQARDDAGDPLPEEDLVDEILTLLFAGHETTGAIMTWAFAAILQREEVRRKILDELDEVVGDGPIQAEHLPRLRYLEAVLYESMRIHPVGPFSAFREVMEPFEILGYRLPAGWVIAHSFSIMSLRPELFPEPYAFRPERFMDGPQEAYHWNPFGGGSRVCAGRGAAMTELKVVVGTILRRARLELLDDGIETTRSGHFIAPKAGLRVACAA